MKESWSALLWLKGVRGSGDHVCSHEHLCTARQGPLHRSLVQNQLESTLSQCLHRHFTLTSHKTAPFQQSLHEKPVESLCLSQPLELLCSFLRTEEDHGWRCPYRDSTPLPTWESHRLTSKKAQMRTGVKGSPGAKGQSAEKRYTLWLTSDRDHFEACVCFMWLGFYLTASSCFVINSWSDHMSTFIILMHSNCTSRTRIMRPSAVHHTLHHRFSTFSIHLWLSC